MNELMHYLQGGDLRSIAKVDQLLPFIKSQSHFEELFRYLHDEDRLIVMRTADAIEKITVRHPEYLDTHKDELFGFLEKAQDKEFKWHLALLVSRLKLTKEELRRVWAQLTKWARDRSESRIVRINSLQSLYNLAHKHKDFKEDFALTMQALEKEKIPSIKARVRKLKLGITA